MCGKMEFQIGMIRRAALSLFPLASFAFQPDPAVLRKVYEEGLARRERQYGLADVRTGQAARDLGLYLKEAGDVKSAIPALRKAVTIDEATYGPDARPTLSDVVSLASVSSPREAEMLLRRAAQSADPEIAGPALATLGDLRKAAGDRAGAAAYWRLALALAEKVYGKDGAVVEMILNSLSQAVEPKEAVTLLERAAQISRSAFGERHPETATTEVNLAQALLSDRRGADAAEAARQGLAGFEATLGPQHPRTATALRILGNALVSTGDRAAAEPLYRRSLEIDRQALGTADKQTVYDARELIAFLRKSGRVREALELQRGFPLSAK